MKHMRRSGFLTSFIALALFLSGALGYPLTAEGVPAMPGIRSHIQSSGGVVNYHAIGDEFLNYLIDANGDILAFGDDGDLYYADWVSEDDFMKIISSFDEHSSAQPQKITGFFVLSDRKPIGQQDNSNPPSESDMQPLNTPIPDYLLEYAMKLMEERDSAWMDRRSYNNGMFGALSDSTAVERNLVVIYVRFEDESNITELKDKELSNTDIYDLVFNDASQGSVAHFYKTVTGGGIKFIPAQETYEAEDDGIIRVTVPGKNNDWGGIFTSFRTDVVRPALTKASQYIDFRNFTKGTVINNGEELSIMFIVHGYESSNSGAPGVWGHAHYGENLGIFNGVMIRAYCAFGAFHSKGTDPRPFTTGIVVHELGHHSFGFIDLYNTNDNYTRGITGFWSVMGLGSWGAVPNEPGGSTPTGLDAYHLSTLFSPTATVSAANITAGQQFSLTNSSQFIKLETSSPGQYFLLQPRGNVGYDRGILRIANPWANPYGGLMIYHIDENKSPGTLNRDWKMHPFLDIEEAHGDPQHLQNYLNDGAINDIFFGANNKFDSTTDPNSKLYDGNTATAQNILSGVSVTEITPVVTGQNTPLGSVTTEFKVGTSLTIVPVTAVSLDKLTIAMNIGEISSLITAISPSNAYDKRVTWTSSNPAVAEVNAGLVTANSAGTAVIRAASVANSNIYANCTVTVGTIPVALLNVSANGAMRAITTTEIDFAFDKSIAGLTAMNITITNISGAATVGEVSGSGKNWKAAIYGVKQGEVSVSVTSYGAYIINGSPKIIEVHSFVPEAPIINTSSLPDGFLGTAYNQTLRADGAAPLIWSIASGKLPDGLDLNGSIGVISGTPTTTGVFSFSVRAENGSGSDTKPLTIIVSTIIIPPVINTTSLPDGFTGVVYDYTLSASGSTPITWTLASGKLPDGLNLIEATGEISGAPTATGVFNFSVRAENTAGYDSKALIINIGKVAAPPIINTSSLPNGVVDKFYSQTLSAGGDEPITWTLDSGSLPNGLSLNETTGEISGTPTTIGTFNFTIRAANAGGADTKALKITIEFENVKVTGITVVPKSVSIDVGAAETLKAMVAPSNATNKNVAWTSSNTSIATVNALGVVSGKSAGTATITVRTDDGGYTDKCSVTVSGGGKKSRILDPRYSTNLEYSASKMTGFRASDLELTEGRVAVKKSISVAIAKKLLHDNNLEVYPLPWFEASVDDGNVAAVRIPVRGALLGDIHPENIMLLKIISPGSGEFLKYAASEVDYDDGKFTLLTRGGETPYSGSINAKAEYDLVIFIKDGGNYDLDKTVNGFVVDPTALVYTNDTPYDIPGGSGCNAYGYLALVLVGIVLKAGIRDKP